MLYFAVSEGMDLEFVYSEVSRGCAITPSFKRYLESELMIVCRNFKVKINSNASNSAVLSSVQAEVKKLQ